LRRFTASPIRPGIKGVRINKEYDKTKEKKGNQSRLCGHKDYDQLHRKHFKKEGKQAVQVGGV
jgi:hypothetical protein